MRRLGSRGGELPVCELRVPLFGTSSPAGQAGVSLGTRTIRGTAASQRLLVLVFSAASVRREGM